VENEPFQDKLYFPNAIILFPKVKFDAIINNLYWNFADCSKQKTCCILSKYLTLINYNLTLTKALRNLMHAGADSARKTDTQVYFRFVKGIIERIAHARQIHIKRIALALWNQLAKLDLRLASLAVRAPLWLTHRFAQLYLEHECITCTYSSLQL
jgi:hypothetical protein